MSACGRPSSGRAIWVPLWVPNWSVGTRYRTARPGRFWLTRAKHRFSDGPVTPEVVGRVPSRRSRPQKPRRPHAVAFGATVSTVGAPREFRVDERRRPVSHGRGSRRRTERKTGERHRPSGARPIAAIQSAGEAAGADCRARERAAERNFWSRRWTMESNLKEPPHD